MQSCATEQGTRRREKACDLIQTTNIEKAGYIQSTVQLDTENELKYEFCSITVYRSRWVLSKEKKVTGEYLLRKMDDSVSGARNG